jgi:hypothetical protein
MFRCGRLLSVAKEKGKGKVLNLICIRDSADEYVLP